MARLPKVFIPAVLILMLTPCIAHANAGVPMLALAWPAQWLTLIPIVLLECAVSRQLLQVPFRQLIWPFAKANLISTLVGIPLAWGVMLIPVFGIALGLSYYMPASVTMPTYLEYLLLPLTAAWISGESVWQIYFAFVVLTVPFCIVSIFIEERVLRRSFPTQNRSVIHTAVVRANVLSYILLSVLALIFPLYSVAKV